MYSGDQQARTMGEKQGNTNGRRGHKQRSRTPPRGPSSSVDDDDVRASGERLSCPHPRFARPRVSLSATAGSTPLPTPPFPRHAVAPSPTAAPPAAAVAVAVTEPPLQDSTARVRPLFSVAGSSDAPLFLP